MINQLYLDQAASTAVREMVAAHAVLHAGRLESVCYLTTAAVSWLLTGADRVPPFSGVWVQSGTGPEDADRAIAFGYEDSDGEFEEDHTLVALARGGRTIIIDSCLAEGRALTVRVLDGVMMTMAPPPRQAARFVLL